MPSSSAHRAGSYGRARRRCARRTTPCAGAPGSSPSGLAASPTQSPDADADAPALDDGAVDRPGQRAVARRARAGPRRPTDGRRPRRGPARPSRSARSRRRRGARPAVGLAGHDAAAGEHDDEAVGRRGDQLRGRAELAQRAVDDDRDAAGERRRVGEVVGDEQRRDARLAQLAGELVAHERGGCGRRARRAARRAAGPRAARQRAGERDALALAAAQAARGSSPARWAMPQPRRAARPPSSAAAPENATLRATVRCGKSAWCWGT